MPAALYPPLALRVTTPRLALQGATDDLLAELLPTVRAGVVTSPEPFDDPMSLYEPNPRRERLWLQAIWRGRGTVRPDAWRLYFAVLWQGRPVGMQDLIGVNFDTCRTVTSFSWLAPDVRGQGLGREMRAAILHLAFAGFGAAEAASDALFDNAASNRISAALGYQPNGTDWATRRGQPVLVQRWRLQREAWARTRRDDIQLAGVEACRPVLFIEAPESA
ncbi:GNAT family N-acetyltransferase [Deinococcus multiflagellatus]|uniref:GNAT family N-acetyltransferase n=1 Tax=Deinococcus multiflagellatus TaxID=1656887 RepID=A0ABW1ZIU5_9DEIO|nr:GNAT family protein [Deinococcus multiflagellatus]MBZ9712613.1 GNAT family N-acetyltransferase [Deinococcus multiflagellatus]